MKLPGQPTEVPFVGDKRESLYAVILNGKLLLDEGRLPIFYRRNVARELQSKYAKAEVVKVKIIYA